MIDMLDRMNEPAALKHCRFYDKPSGRPAVSIKRIIRTVEFKLYPSAKDEAALHSWLRLCCWTYNQALEQRIKAYRRRGESLSFYDQCATLTGWRSRMESLRPLPVNFQRAALNRLDRGMKAFFRRCRAGEKPGFPRFRSHRRYNSLECLEASDYIGEGTIRVPKLGNLRARGQFGVTGQQKLLRVIRRASGWYSQIVLDQGPIPETIPVKTVVGIDVGLTHFAAMSTGETIANPRLLRRSEQLLNRLQRRVSRKQRRSSNRRKAVKRLARQHERVAAQRRDFAHKESRKLVNRFDLIAFEKLNIKGLAGSRLAKSVHDVAWGLFLFLVTVKAAWAGRVTEAVDPRGTSQTCPVCGAVRAKSLSEREHSCPCGCRLDRDVASAKIVLARATWSSRRVTPVEGSTAATVPRRRQVGPAKQEVRSGATQR